jgi:hypothetical protein
VQPDAQPPQVLDQAPPELIVIGERGVKAIGGGRDESIDRFHVVVVRRGRPAADVDETQEELGYGGNIGVTEDEARSPLHRGGDPRGGFPDRMIDERPELTALEFGCPSGLDAPGNDRQIECRDDRHRLALVQLSELIEQDRPMGPKVQTSREVRDPIRSVFILDPGTPVAARLVEQDLGRHGLENEGEEAFADIDLGAAHHEADTRQVLEMEVVLLEPMLGRMDVATHRRSRRPELDFEIRKVERLRCLVEQGRERLELSVRHVEDLGSGLVIET